MRYARGKALIADLGYDSAEVVSAIRRRKMKAVIPSQKTRKVRRRPDKALYALRYEVECFFHRLKRFRAVATRYDKTARNYLATVHLACALLWLN